MDISNSLAGLTLLTGSNAFAIYGTSSSSTSAAPAESSAQRRAKALFTTPATRPPWITNAKGQTVGVGTPPSVSDVLGMSSIIDTPATGSNTLPADAQTDFTVYKALDRLQTLAQSAADPGTGAARRATLQKAFAQGLSQLQTFLAGAPSNQLTLAFDQPTSTIKTIVMPTSQAAGPAIQGNAVNADRYAPLTGLSGNEKFTLTLSKGTETDAVAIDLSQVAQPPTLDGVATAISSAVAAIPLRGADGNVVTDSSGNAVPRWEVSAVVTKSTGGWGLTIKRTGNEHISIDQAGGDNALMAVANVTTPYAATAAQVIQFGDPSGAMTEQTQGVIAAVDPGASAMAALEAPASSKISTTVNAATSANGVAVDSQGFSYVVGTTSGTLGSNVGGANSDLFLSKRDSEGNVVWQRDLGATASAQGAAVTVAPDGGVVVAGTITGSFNGSNADGDMLVAKYGTDGTEQFASVVRSAGADTATSVAVAQDGTIYVGGQSANGGGTAFVARLSASGLVQQRDTIAFGSASVAALAVDPNGQLLALAQQGTDTTLYRLDGSDLSNQLGSIDLGAASGRALAVDANGTVIVGGTTLAPLNGSQVNSVAGGRDGFVTRISSDLASASTTYLGSSGTDQVNSLAIMGGRIYAGGTTTGSLGGDRVGTTDGFVGQIDEASGAIQKLSQFGQASSQTGQVYVAAAPGNDTALGALGLHRGLLTDQLSDKLVTVTSLRVGDSFSIAVNNGSAIKFTIGANDTLSTLSTRLSLLTGGKATVTTPTTGKGQSLQIAAKAGASVELIAGPAGQDALAKLGLAPQTLSLPPTPAAHAPPVSPGGRYGLGLSTNLSIGNSTDAAASLTAITHSISMIQTAFRSLYWDSTKAALADGGSGSASGRSAAVSRAQAQTAQYQAALDRLTGTTTTTSTDTTGWTSVYSALYPSA